MIANRNLLPPVLAIAGTWLVVVLIFLPPFVGVGPRAMLMSAFSSVCHQLPARSAHIDGVSLAVCHRCTGIFFGLAAGTAIFLFAMRHGTLLVKHAGWVIIAALVPLFVDWGADVVGLWSNTAASRAATGSTFGLAMGALLISSIRPKKTDGGGRP